VIPALTANNRGSTSHDITLHVTNVIDYSFICLLNHEVFTELFKRGKVFMRHFVYNKVAARALKGIWEKKNTNEGVS